MKIILTVTGIDHASRTVTIAPPVPGSTQEEGKPYQIGYDHLVLALGAEARTLPIPGLAEQALGFKQVEEALALRNRVLSRIEDAASTWDAERRRRLLTFVFVGGGFAGVEAIAELEDMARALVATVDSVEQADVRFILVEGSRRILPELTEELSGYGLEQLRERGIDVRLNTFLSSCVDGHVVLSDGTELDADTIVWTAGVKAAPVLSESDLPVEARGRVTTLPTLQVARDGVVVPGAWAAGDCAAVPDLTSEDPQATCAPTAQHAVRQAAILADNLVTVLTGPAEGDGSSGQGEQRLAVYAHENLGTVASLGIGKGVARIMGQNLRGFTAWTAHRGYHVYAMPTLNRKVRIMMDWFAAVVFRRDLASFGSVAAPGAAFAQATRNDAKIASRKKS